MQERIRDICLRLYKIHEGDEYGIPRDCPVKRAYKLGMQEAKFKEISSAVLEVIKVNAGKEADQIMKYVDAVLESYG